MGAVYEAEHTEIGTRIAIKVLRSEHVLNPNVVRRFQQEARSTAKIGHPNIVAVLDLDRDSDGTLFMVQELLSGMDLATHLRTNGALSPTLAVRLCVPVCSALAAAHERGVLHRDLKPANIFLARAPGGAVTPKVIDFGVAKVLEGTYAGQTTDGTIMGTLAYMSPEQLLGDPGIDGRTDVWAMGVVLYELLSGVLPFAAPTEMNIAALAQFATRVNSEAPPPIESIVTALPSELSGIVRRALALRREDRFATMTDLHDALAGCSVPPDAGIAAAADAGTVVGLKITDSPPAPRAPVNGTNRIPSRPSLPTFLRGDSHIVPRQRHPLLWALVGATAILVCVAIAKFAQRPAAPSAIPSMTAEAPVPAAPTTRHEAAPPSSSTPTSTRVDPPVPSAVATPPAIVPPATVPTPKDVPAPAEPTRRIKKRHRTQTDQSSPADAPRSQDVEVSDF